MKERTDRACILDKAQRRGAGTCAHVNEWVPRLGPSVISCTSPDHNAQVLDMVLDLHLPEDWDMGPDPFQELWNRQVSSDSGVLLCEQGREKRVASQ